MILHAPLDGFRRGRREHCNRSTNTTDGRTRYRRVSVRRVSACTPSRLGLTQDRESRFFSYLFKVAVCLTDPLFTPFFSHTDPVAVFT